MSQAINIDLFGQPVSGVPVCTRNGKPIRKKTRPNGYAHPPGTGPAGETCKTCANYVRVQHGKRRWPKCLLLKYVWTCGPGTDIRAKSPACALWKKVEGPTKTTI